jgi:chromosome segregation ATPase
MFDMRKYFSSFVSKPSKSLGKLESVLLEKIERLKQTESELKQKVTGFDAHVEEIRHEQDTELKNRQKIIDMLQSDFEKKEKEYSKQITDLDKEKRALYDKIDKSRKTEQELKDQVQQLELKLINEKITIQKKFDIELIDQTDRFNDENVRQKETYEKKIAELKQTSDTRIAELTTELDKLTVQSKNTIRQKDIQVQQLLTNEKLLKEQIVDLQRTLDTTEKIKSSLEQKQKDNKEKERINDGLEQKYKDQLAKKHLELTGVQNYINKQKEDYEKVIEEKETFIFTLENEVASLKKSLEEAIVKFEESKKEFAGKVVNNFNQAQTSFTAKEQKLADEVTKLKVENAELREGLEKLSKGVKTNIESTEEEKEKMKEELLQKFDEWQKEYMEDNADANVQKAQMWKEIEWLKRKIELERGKYVKTRVKLLKLWNYFRLVLIIITGLLGIYIYIILKIYFK